MNKVTLVGRLTKEPELRYTQSQTAVTSFTLAVDRRKKEDGADFINCVAWSKTAELVKQYVHKGHRLGVAGRISTRSHEDSNNTRHYVVEVTADEIEFLQPKEESQPQMQGVDVDLDVNDDVLPF